MSNSLIHKFIEPDESITDYVYGFTSLKNLSGINEGVIIPNGRIDLHFTETSDRRFQIFLVGLESRPKPLLKQNISTLFSISFNPLATEYILHQSITDLLDGGKAMPENYWDFGIGDLKDFDGFCEKAARKIRSRLPEKIDERKRKLFELIFAANGEMSVRELSEKILWSERQINRYFNRQFGIPLKAYCQILRFQASLSHIKVGELYPQLDFADQSHFIKEIKKLAGVSPKELYKNENDRFLQFLVMDTD